MVGEKRGQYRIAEAGKEGGEVATIYTAQLPSATCIPLSESLRVIWTYFSARITTTTMAHAMSRVPKITPYSSPSSVVLSTPVVGGPVVVGGLALGTVRLMEPCRRWRGIIRMIQWESQFLHHKEEHHLSRDTRGRGISDNKRGIRDKGRRG